MKRFSIHLIMTLAIVLAGLVAAPTASAEFCKAAKSTSYKGVEAKIFDRRTFTGRDTYGYVDYYNKNEYPVTVAWKVYGHMRGKKTMTCVDSGSFTIPAAKHTDINGIRHGEVFVYREDLAPDPKEGWTEYYVSFDVKKGTPQTAPVQTPAIPDAPADYKSVVDKMRNNTASQEDYDYAISICSAYADFIMDRVGSFFDGDHDELARFEKQYAKEIEIFQTLAYLLDEAEAHGKLNSANKTNLKRLKKKCEDFSRG